MKTEWSPGSQIRDKVKSPTYGDVGRKGQGNYICDRNIISDLQRYNFNRVSGGGNGGQVGSWK